MKLMMSKTLTSFVPPGTLELESALVIFAPARS
jgi:hypothetical protein